MSSHGDIRPVYSICDTRPTITRKLFWVIFCLLKIRRKYISRYISINEIYICIDDSPINETYRYINFYQASILTPSLSGINLIQKLELYILLLILSKSSVNNWAPPPCRIHLFYIQS